MTDANSNSMTTWVRWLASLVLLLCSLVLIGYETRSKDLISLFPNLNGMAFSTALALSCIAISLLFDNTSKISIRIASSFTLLIALAMLGSHALYGADRINGPLTGFVFKIGPEIGGRTSVATALCLLLLALTQHLRAARRPAAADNLAGLTLLISGVALIGYAYDVIDLYRLYIFNTMAVHSTAAVFVLAIASILAQPEGGLADAIASIRADAGGTRRLFAFVMLPPVAGWWLLRLNHHFDLGTGVVMALLVILTVVPLLVLLTQNIRILAALGKERAEKSQFQATLELDLRQRLAEQASELQREAEIRARADALVQRAQRIDTVGQLSGGIAHNFNNLLMAISGNLQLLQLHLPAEHGARNYAEKAAAATAKGARLTAQLLAFSRIQRINRVPLQVDQVLGQGAELVRNTLGPRIDTFTRFDSGGAWVKADSEQLEFAILNLALNARDAMPDGGHFTIETGIVDADTGPQVSIRLGDTGCGMSAPVLARAGEPFFTTKPVGQGTGLGIAQVQNIVQQSGGSMQIRSEPGVGTQVEILLPAIEHVLAQASPAAPFNTPAAPAIDGRSLLLIDDDAEVRYVFVELLRSMGYSVLEAKDGPEGLSVLSEARPALAIIDFLMPGMNGAEVARQARQIQPGLPIIFISGYSDTEALDQVPNSVLLRKPVDNRDLQHAVAAALGAA